MSEYLTTRELAELLRIKERKVYDLAASGSIPCSKATGKLLFPREGVNSWLVRNASGGNEFLQPSIPRVFLGSHDPLLEWALRDSQSAIATYFDGSLDGIERFIAGSGIATGLHIHDSELDEWNLSVVRERCSTLPVVLVEWAKRSRGLILNPQQTKSVHSLQDIKGLALIARQPGSGAQQNFLQQLKSQSIQYEDINVVSIARSEQDAALSVLEGKGDVTFGLESVASQYQLPFVSIMKEQFDLLVRRKDWFDDDFQQFFSFCQTSIFRQQAETMQGYCCADLGNVRFNGPAY